MNRSNCLSAVVVGIALAIGSIDQAFGQTRDADFSRYIPKSAVAAAVAFPSEIGTNPKAELFPREIVTAWGQENLGVDPMSIASVVMLLDQPSKEEPPQWGCIIRFAKATEIEPSDGEQFTFEGKPAFRLQGMNEFILVAADDRTILLGPEAYLPQMLGAEKTENDLTRMIAKEASPTRIVVLVDVKAIRPFLSEIIGELAGQVPPPLMGLSKLPQLTDLTELHKSIDSLMFHFEADLESPLTIKINSPDAASAEHVDATIQNGLEFAVQMFDGQMASQMNPDDPVQAATEQYLERIGKHFQELAKPALAGNTLEYRIQSGPATIGVLVGLLLPAVQSVREAARRTETMNRVRQMLLTILNYESAYAKFPADICDADGKPLLSWRVAIMPFIDGQMGLYEQFHLDEPWDSEHNKALLEQMPEEWKSAGIQLPPGMCNLVGVSGPGTFLGSKTLTVREILDGLSNTIAIVEVNADRSVPWTQPADWTSDPDDPLDGLGKVRAGGFNVGFLDGSVQFIRTSIDVETWQALLTIAGREVIRDFR